MLLLKFTSGPIPHTYSSQAVTGLLKEEKIWNAVRHHIEYYHANQELETYVFSPTTYTIEEQEEEKIAAAASIAKKSGGGRQSKKRKSSSSISEQEASASAAESAAASVVKRQTR